jgi:hypothetical protein
MPELRELTLEIDPVNQSTFGPCECCGQMTSRVWGYVYRFDEAIAAYYVEWTPGHGASQANFDILIGEWGEAASSSDRSAVCLEFRKLESGPAFMVIDAKTRSVAANSLVSSALDRDDVIGTALAPRIFAICDLIFLEDPRISELTH